MLERRPQVRRDVLPTLQGSDLRQGVPRPRVHEDLGQVGVLLQFLRRGVPASETEGEAVDFLSLGLPSALRRAVLDEDVPLLRAVLEVLQVRPFSRLGVEAVRPQQAFEAGEARGALLHIHSRAGLWPTFFANCFKSHNCVVIFENIFDKREARINLVSKK